MEEDDGRQSHLEETEGLPLLGKIETINDQAQSFRTNIDWHSNRLDLFSQSLDTSSSSWYDPDCQGAMN